MIKVKIILGIESTCDETAASVTVGGRKILSDVIFSQADLHKKYGGVVPEIASRKHIEVISAVIYEALDKAGVKKEELDAVAVSHRPGLIGAVLVGTSVAKGFAYALKKPLVPVNHIHGHIAANYLANESLEPPFVCLVASGGHSHIIQVSDYTNYEILGATLDDAAGEAFDKVARVLGLPYPGGPNVERLAKEGENTVKLPKMLKGEGGYNFSYSGLKTAVINYTHGKEQKGESYERADVANSFQHSAIDILVQKSIEACKEYNLSTLTAGGGVVANGYLRESLEKACKAENINLVLPPKNLCTDNAAMIGAEGFVQYKNRNFADLALNAKAKVEF